MIKIHKQKCENNDTMIIRNSSESHVDWKKHFHKNPFYFRIYADFGVDNEIDNFNTGNKTTIFINKNDDIKVIIKHLN